MGLLYAGLILSFMGLIVFHSVFGIVNFYFWIVNGVDFVLKGENFIETIYFSVYLKWIGLLDLIWISSFLTFLIKRKHYKTDEKQHYLSENKISNPKICVVIPTYNEEKVVKEVIDDFKNQKNVSEVLIIDNHSEDNTIKIARECNATVITKEKNLGFAHSCVLGLKKALETNANVIILTECDGTFSGDDIKKFTPYLDNCDMVIGTRQIQVLTEKGNQNSMFYVWGNYLLAKIIQIKYFSLLHLGIVELTDVGCTYRAIRREGLEKIIKDFENPKTSKVKIGADSGLFAIFMTLLGIEKNLRIVEIPVIFKKRIGTSKTQAEKKSKGIKYGLIFFWYIITH
ncbi:glycosyltransferase family 2 protein [Nitrosopumilus sp.]|jgi:glycosyltransferase involved in cell wall biosynthesis|nr:glycosyltransferase family 2 protein [Nitrosopumilus sp.]|tara:strand:+ start:405 stop:1430 length:1026 start_codon:yes stop_codon:yes gene_type:complete